ncbi:hypothetical protein HGM15179_020134 [Zosterops borbonicus]|uniref:Uncharacterized protein n=1 Tax=Zosterops borbonicus TaxID=364589 RepID=A0A8K1D6V7_9PASS|nr:hypothetical protein HGM15179_020134 [Zosterops borbonicus]
MGRHIDVYVLHMVTTVLEQKGGYWLSLSQILKFQVNLTEQENVALKTINLLNPTLFLGTTAEEGLLEHDGVEVIEDTYEARADMKDVPLEQSEWELFTDGSSFMENRIRYAGYAVTTIDTVVEAKALPPNTSAQGAELVALTRALELSEGKTVNIWTDSKYAFGVLHVHRALWKERGLLSSQGTYIKHQDAVLQLINAVQKPEQVVIMHCKTHQSGNSKICEGNRKADWTALQVAREEQKPMTLITSKLNVSQFNLPPKPKYTVDDRLAHLLKAQKNTEGWFGVLLGISSDRGPHFEAIVVQEVSRLLGISWDLHTLWRPQSSGQVERMNQRLKGQISKICQEAKLQWPQALPIAFMRIRIKSRSGMSVSPYETLYGKPYESPDPNPNVHVTGKQDVYNYVLSLGKTLAQLRSVLLWNRLLTLENPVHDIEPGDEVYIRTRKEEPLKEKWTGPHQVLLTTFTAVKVAGVEPCIHYTRVKKVLHGVQSWAVQAVGPTKLRIKHL